MDKKFSDKESVLKFVKDNKVEFIRLWFTDVLGFLKSFEISPAELDEALSEGMGFDGSSVEGYARIEESDMIAMPDPATFTILPFGNDSGPTIARMFCNIQEPDGSPYVGDPRQALKENLKKAKNMGYTFYVGPELEYFYFNDSSGDPGTLDAGGYFDLTPHDVASPLRTETALALEKMGIKVEFSLDIYPWRVPLQIFSQGDQFVAVFLPCTQDVAEDLHSPAVMMAKSLPIGGDELQSTHAASPTQVLPKPILYMRWGRHLKR